MTLMRYQNRSDEAPAAAGAGTEGDAELGAGGASGAETRTLARRTPRGRIMVTRVGLEFPPVLDFGAWEQAGLKIARIADSSAWCLGDWLIYGQDLYTDRYRHAVAMAGLDYQTLRNYAWVARRFPLARRRERLSFQHHAEVAALCVQDQDRWLDQAEAGAWSRNQLRRTLRAERQPSSAEAGAALALLRLSPTAEKLARWREAAECGSQEFEDWIVATLDDRASRTLADRSGPVATVSTETTEQTRSLVGAH
jgi:hypothetical protein